MGQPFLQSTLRELTVFARSWRFWATFAVIVLIFTWTGPFGTFKRMPVGMRFGYWLTVHAFAWATAVTFTAAAAVLLRARIARLFWRMMTGSLLAAIPIGIILSLVDLAFGTRTPTVHSVVEQIISAVPLCALFCALTYMTMGAKIENAATGGVSVPVRAAVPLLDRLKPENRGALLRLSVQDHYTEVETSRGRELILLRFSDALKEIGETQGLQVHRSHWVADIHVKGLKRGNGKLALITAQDTEIPVSRTYQDAVRQRFARSV